MKKTPGPVGFTGEFYQTLLEEIIFLHKPFWNIEEWEIFRSWTIFWFRCCASNPYLWKEERQQPPTECRPGTESGLDQVGVGAESKACSSGWGRFLGRNLALSMPRLPFVAAQLMSVLASKLGVCVLHRSIHYGDSFPYQHTTYNLDQRLQREKFYFRSKIWSMVKEIWQYLWAGGQDLDEDMLSSEIGWGDLPHWKQQTPDGIWVPTRGWWDPVRIQYSLP